MSREDQNRVTRPLGRCEKEMVRKNIGAKKNMSAVREKCERSEHRERSERPECLKIIGRIVKMMGGGVS